MERPHILHMFSPLPHVSPFDVNMALDAGFQNAIPYINVEVKQVSGLVQDAIFSRGPKGAKRTGVFIGGRNAIDALDMFDAAKGAMFPPFQVSVFVDPAGAFTTAAAMVALVEKRLKETDGKPLEGRTVAVFGGTGVIGFTAAVIAALEGAHALLVGYDGPTRVERFAVDAKARFEVELEPVDGSEDEMKHGILGRSEIVLCLGRAGTRVLTKEHLAHAGGVSVIADINAVPPSGVEGVEADADGTPVEGTDAVGIGALTVGNVKYKVESGLFDQMLAADDPRFIDFRDAFTLARTIVAG